MRKALFLLLPALLALSSCDLLNGYGKKVVIGESEVYYKGDGVTEKDAQNVGNFLLENQLISKEKRSSAQVTKKDSTYTVHLIMDAKKMDPSLKLNMWKLQSDLSAEAFNGAAARIAFTDDKFNDEEVLAPVSELKAGKGSVIYNSAEFKPQSISELSEFFKVQGFLTDDKETNLFVTKEEGAPVIRVVYDKEFMQQNEATALPVFGYLQYLIQTNYPAFKTAKIWLTTKNYEDFKTIPDLSQQEIAAFENSQTGSAGSTASYNTADSTAAASAQY